MRGRAVALRGVAEFSRVGLGESDQVGNGLGGRTVLHCQNVGGDRHDRHRLERGRIVVELLEQDCIGGEGVGRRGEQGIAIGFRFRDRLSRDVVAAAGPVFHRDRVAPQLLELVGDNPRRQVDAAARGRGADDLDRPGRETRLRRLRAGLHSKQGGGQTKQSREIARPAHVEVSPAEIAATPVRWIWSSYHCSRKLA